MATNSAINTGKPIEVTKGGTGIATTTAYGVIAGGTTSTGSLQNTGTGTTGQVLTSAGSASLPVWAASSSVSGLILIQTQTANNSATIDFTTGISTSYNNYLVIVSNYLPATNATNLLLRFSNDGGSTFTATGYNTGSTYTAYNSTTKNNTNATNGIMIIPSSTNNSANGTGAAFHYLTFIEDVNRDRETYGMASVYNTVAATSVVAWTVGRIDGGTTNPTNAIRFISSSGNITTGQFSLYALGA